MKKVIRLTESDLYRIVKRVISEELPPTGGTQTSTTNTTTPTIRRTQDQFPKRKMDYEWHAEKIGDILLNLLRYTGAESLWDLKWGDKLENKLRNPTEKKFLMDKYIIPLGKLVDPNNAEKMGEALLDAYLSIRPKSFHKKEGIFDIRDTEVGKALVRRINYYKNQDAPN